MVGELSLDAPYSASQYEHDCLELLERLFREHDALIASGGSSMYIDALRHGLDDIPTVETSVREQLKRRLAEDGLAALAEELRRRDPDYWATMDRNNPRRVVHALEICVQTGRSYSSFLTGRRARRDFRVLTIALCRPVEELYRRINLRVDEMLRLGLEHEARAALPYRDCTSLNTVGYKEMFDYFDGRLTLPQAVEAIKSHTRAYSRKQLTWLRRDSAALWFSANIPNSVIRFALDIIGQPEQADF